MRLRPPHPWPRPLKRVRHAEKVEAIIGWVGTRGFGRALLAPALAIALLVSGCSAAGAPQRPPAAPATAASPAPSPTPSPSSTATPFPGPTVPPGTRPASRFVAEKPDSGWREADASPAFGISPGTRAAAKVEGYADQSSVAGGHRVQLFVSTSADRWRATAYRMGWYGGKQGASVWRSGWQKGKLQARPRTSGARLTPVADWDRSLSVSTTGWRPGTYLIRLEVAHHASYVPLTVRSPSTRGRLVLLAPDTTWQAYNDWGGRNLYWGPTGKSDYAHRARAVTFDRPYAYGKGGGEFVNRMLPVVSLAEKLKLPLAYVDDVDLERDPHLLDGARGVISMGHDEYYSNKMRANLTAARDAGTNLAFLGANAIYRRIRFESTSLGKLRLEVNYKAAAEDPLSRTHPKQTTADWPANPSPDPESSLTGEAYACFPGAGNLVVLDPSSWLLAGTGLGLGDTVPNVLGPEFDAVTAGSPTPHPLDVVLRSPVYCGPYTHADATYYST
ncbi:MAG TPA: N,N-dimethylformamidase beta subunit family domain-containing protein, partial [Friedmanniella sp.]